MGPAKAGTPARKGLETGRGESKAKSRMGRRTTPLVMNSRSANSTQTPCLHAVGSDESGGVD